MRHSTSRASRVRFLVLFGLLVVGIPGLWLLAGVAKQTAVPTPPTRGFLQSVEKFFSGTIRLAGVVVDEEGNPLKDVTMAIRESRFDLKAESFSSDTSRDITIHGHFDERCFGCDGLMLTFMKAGYFEEQLSFSVRSKELAKEPGTDKVGTTGLRVVLMRKGVLPPLVRIGGGISGGAAERLDILPVEPATGRTASSTFALRGGKLFAFTSPRKDETEKVPVSAPYLYLTSPGGFGAPFEAGSRPYPSSPGRSVTGVPVSVLLCASQEGDGFVVFEPKRYYLAFREMREAPTEGYQRCIPAPIAPVAIDRQETFFYCRIGSLYGKGEVLQAAFSGFKPGVVEAPVWLLMNPEGTRNVAGER